MSVKVRALRGLVLDRLSAAADEIFALFERTFAQYEEEILRSKLAQQPRDEEIRSVNVSVEICSDRVVKEEPASPKQDVNPPSVKLECPSPSRKPKEPDPADERERQAGNLTREQCDGEEPGHSVDPRLDDNKRPYSCSDTDDSADWAEETSKCGGQELNPSLVKDSAENHLRVVSCDHIFSSNAVVNYGGTSLDQTLRCPQCCKVFKSAEALQKHVPRHARKKEFICQICNKGYSTRSSFRKHLHLHSEKKPFMCSFCDRGFVRRQNFEEHTRIHTGERPFSCSDCGRKFRHKNAIIRHVLSQHSKEKPYSCPVCQKGFVENKHFGAHMRKHHSETIRASSLWSGLS
ncbi:zinc finger protein 599-like isoform X2 [Boleophthalmus pectinirostris]|uniref:zinc finger protein 599-like isoform X2 n=1 Tax=Boleophthalmus pectinirostris TaxID=150288 RepID=UPI0024330CBB|nr:zinc finger protein 599-like isoform X2 [Boleophthalmus pectinirostris]